MFQDWLEMEKDKRTNLLGALNDKLSNDPNFVQVGIVLTGGGAKGDFQVGALDHIYNKFKPGDPTGPAIKIISGSSVGALNGTKLAEGPNANPNPLSQLKQIWTSIADPNDIYIDGPELAAFKTAISGVTGLNELIKSGILSPGSRWFATPSIDLKNWSNVLSSELQMLNSVLNPSKQSLKGIIGILDALTSTKPGALITTTTQLQQSFGLSLQLVEQLKTDVQQLQISLNDFLQHLNDVVQQIESLLSLSILSLAQELNNAATNASELPGQLLQIIQEFINKVSTPVIKLATDLGSMAHLVSSIAKIVKKLATAAKSINLNVIQSLIDSSQHIAGLVAAFVTASNLNNAHSLFEFSPLKSLIAAGLNTLNITNSGIKLHVGFVSLETGEYRWADETWPHDHLVNAIIASASIPVFFPPVIMNLEANGTGFSPIATELITGHGGSEQPLTEGDHYVDGGVRLLAPLTPVLDYLKNDPTDRSKDHLNMIFLVSCSSLELPGWSYIDGYSTEGEGGMRLLNVLGRTMDIFLNTTLYDNLLDQDIAYRTARAAANAIAPGFQMELRDQYRQFRNAIVWAGGKPIDDFPNLGILNPNFPGSQDPMPGDTLIWFIDPDPTYNQLRDTMDFNGTKIQGTTIIEEGIAYGAAQAQWIFDGMNGARTPWNIQPSFSMFDY